jgi:hypothetical protein
MTPDRETVPGQPGVWHGRRRWVPFIVAATAIIAINAITAHQTETRLFDLAVVVAGIACVYRYWSDPLPPGYAQRIARSDNEPRFGTKRRHKFALAFVALFVVWIAVAVVGALLSR